MFQVKQFTMTTHFTDQDYVKIFLSPIRECAKYKPHFGHSHKKNGLNLEEFLQLYQNDPFYSWIGLDTPLMYAAHKAAGSMTSIYRQIGCGCEYLFRQILFDCAKYKNMSSCLWSYKTQTKSGKTKILSLDGRLELSDIQNIPVKEKVLSWIRDYCQQLEIDNRNINGVVFEVRQGYKSKDSKRQNGDLDNATVAHAHNYLPVFTIFSSQIDEDIVLRYKNNRCGILIGTPTGNAYQSLFVFCRDILQYDLADFFNRNSKTFKEEIHKLLNTLFKE